MIIVIILVIITHLHYCCHQALITWVLGRHSLQLVHFALFATGTLPCVMIIISVHHYDCFMVIIMVSIMVIIVVIIVVIFMVMIVLIVIIILHL